MARTRRQSLKAGKGTLRVDLQPPPECSDDERLAPSPPATSSPLASGSACQVFAEMPQCSPSCSVTLGTQDTASPSAPPPVAPAASSWADVVKDNRLPEKGSKLPFIPPLPSCIFKPSEVDAPDDTWGPTLIGYVAGKFPGKQAIIDCTRTWTVPSRFSIHASGWLLFRFNNESDLNTVLNSGPYFIFHRPLLLKALPPFFDFANDEICHVPVWVRLPSLPFELWNAHCLGKILSYVGLPLRTDHLTATHARASYARALVEVDASVERVYEVDITLPTGRSLLQRVEYEYVPHYCTHCKSIGHRAASCKNGTPQETPPAPKPSPSVPDPVLASTTSASAPADSVPASVPISVPPPSAPSGFVPAPDPTVTGPASDVPPPSSVVSIPTVAVSNAPVAALQSSSVATLSEPVPASASPGSASALLISVSSAQPAGSSVDPSCSQVVGSQRQPRTVSNKHPLSTGDHKGKGKGIQPLHVRKRPGGPPPPVT